MGRRPGGRGREPRPAGARGLVSPVGSSLLSESPARRQQLAVVTMTIIIIIMSIVIKLVIKTIIIVIATMIRALQKTSKTPNSGSNSKVHIWSRFENSRIRAFERTSNDE